MQKQNNNFIEGKINNHIGRVAGTYRHSEETKRKIGTSNSKKLNGRKLSEETKKRMSLSKLGEKNYNWTGCNKRYIHLWIEREKGKAKNHICEICKRNQAKDWSNIDHKYKKDIKDYMALCRSCHKKYDIQFNNMIIFNRNK